MRPERLWVVTGTGTEVGKTYVAAELARAAIARGMTVSVRKPVQSHDPADGAPLDSEVLAEATGESAADVCRVDRTYPRAVAPPMAATILGRPPILIDELVDELRWPDPPVDLGLVEGAGGSRSPLAADGDTLTFAQRCSADRLVLVADAGLGTIHAVRSAVDALASWPVESTPRLTVVLNRYDPLDELHRWNLSWLVDRDSLDVVSRTVELLDRA